MDLVGDRSAINALIYELINNFNRVYGVSVYAGEGECDLESYDLYQGMLKNDIVLLGDKQADSKCALVYSQYSELKENISSRTDLAAFTLAEHFCDVGLQNVLLFQNTDRQFDRWIYTNSDFERYVPNTIASPNFMTRVSLHYDGKYNKKRFPDIDAVINLSFVEDARPGIFPAIEHVSSMSCMLSKKYVGDDHFRVANHVKNLLAHYKQWQLLPEGECKERVLKDHGPGMIRVRKVINFLTQPPGKFVTQDDCVKGFAVNTSFDAIS